MRLNILAVAATLLLAAQPVVSRFRLQVDATGTAIDAYYLALNHASDALPYRSTYFSSKATGTTYSINKADSSLSVIVAGGGPHFHAFQYAKSSSTNDARIVYFENATIIANSGGFVKPLVCSTSTGTLSCVTGTTLKYFYGCGATKELLHTGSTTPPSGCFPINLSIKTI